MNKLLLLLLLQGCCAGLGLGWARQIGNRAGWQAGSTAGRQRKSRAGCLDKV